MIRKGISVFLALCLMLTLLPVSALAGEDSGYCGVDGSNVSWNFSGSTLTLSGTGGTEDCIMYADDGEPAGYKPTPWDSYKDSIQSVIIESGITSIGGALFCAHEGLTDVSIPDSVVSIGPRAFEGCTSLINVTLPNSLTSIGQYAFLSSGLNGITIPGSVTSFGANAFSLCSRLSSATIEEGVEVISSNAFFKCSNLTDVTIPDSVTSIEAGAFGYTGLREVWLPDDLAELGMGAFAGCTQLSAFKGALQNFYIEDGVLFNRLQSQICAYPAGKQETNYTIPNSVVTIGDGAFYGCSGLTSITMPAAVASIGMFAFSDCANLISVSIPNSVRTIGNSAFLDCASLSSLTIPKSVTTIGDRVFRNCTGLTSISVEEGSSYFSSQDGVLFNASKSTLYAYPAAKRDAAYSVPDGVTSISGNAFSHCENLTEVTIPGSVASTGTSLFEYCSNLTSVIVSEGLRAIEGYTFSNCKKLTSLTIPVSVSSIYFTAFYNCPALKDIYYAGTEEQWDNIAVNASTISNITIHYNSEIDVPAGDPKILGFSPESGAEFPGTVFDITFDREIAERASNKNSPEVDLTLAEPFRVHRASDDSVVYTPSEFSWPQFTYGPSRSVLRITPNYSSANGGTLVPGEQYYITMGAGFVKFTDGKTSPEIKKGDWTFTVPTQTVSTGFVATNVPVLMGTNVDDGEARVYVDWKDAWFESDATAYNHSLATTAVALAGAAYSGNASRPNSDHIKSALQGFEFGPSDIIDFNYDEDYYNKLSVDSNDSAGYVIASKEIATGPEPVVLITVIVKGTSKNEEWHSNFNIGTNGNYHEGFHCAAEEIETIVNSYISGIGLDKEHTKLFITGHSRGAAIANILGAYYTNSDYADQNSVFVYTFATPTVSANTKERGYENIFNIVNPEDFVARVPLDEWGFKHWGIDLALPTVCTIGDYSGFAEAHDITFKRLTEKNYHSYNGTATVNRVLENTYELLPKISEYDTKKFSTLWSTDPSITLHEFFKYVANASMSDSWGTLSMMASRGQFAKLSNFFIAKTITNQIGHAHSIANYYSWLSSYSSAALWKNTSVSSSSSYKSCTIHCPVNVYVYDENNVLVSSVVNEEVVVDDLDIYVADGTKYVDIPSYQNYRIELEAYTSGTVTYEITEHSMTGTKISDTRTVRMSNINVNENDTLSGNVNPIVNTPNINYTLTKTTESGVTTTIPAASDTLPSNPAPAPGGNTSTGGSSSSRGGGSSSGVGYSISVPGKLTGGKVSVSPSSARKGSTVTVTVTLEEGYMLDKLTVRDSKGTELSLTEKGSGKYTFTMPGAKVTVDAAIIPINGDSNRKTAFTDVQPGAYCYDAVGWAVEQGITNGTTDTTFSPNQPCTRAQIVTFLWRAAGSPKASGSNPFTDVDAGSYYYDAVQWAVEQGVTAGTTDTTFSPNNACTRAQAVTFLYRSKQAESSGETEAGQNPFTDVNPDSYYAKAVLWAVDNGVTSGVTASTFSPDTTCTRAQIVTFLYRSQTN